MTENREELIHLSEALPEEKVEQAVAYLRLISQEPRGERVTRRDAWIASGKVTNGRTDNATRVDEILAEGFGR
ncbi:MAG: hypothetical protein QM655_07085 [Nocardioidaceae bacterium]